MENLIQVSVEPLWLDINTLRLDVKIKNAPKDLFGAAFDLKIDGIGWKLQGYEAGEVFKSSGFEPLMLAVEKDVSHRLVSGLSLKSTDTINVYDGTMMSFCLKIEQLGLVRETGSLKVSFEDNVLSSLSGGKRLDLEKVEWLGTSIPFMEIKRESVDINEYSTGDLQANLPGITESINAGRPVSDRGLLQTGWLESPLLQVYLVLLVSFVVILGVTAVVMLKYRLMKNGKLAEVADKNGNIVDKTVHAAGKIEEKKPD